MNKRVLSIILIISLAVNIVPYHVNASETMAVSEGNSESPRIKTDRINGLNESAAIAEGSSRTVNDVISQHKFTLAAGHSFAAEQGNNLIDRIKGKNTIVVGDNNVKNGPDRKIIGRDGKVTYIQDKYYSTPSENINACFDENGFKYIDPDGNLMQIEVPKDQYEAAIRLMEEKIRKGLVPGVKDPEEAKNIVKRGNLTYKNAKNLAKAGTVESLSYDAVHGVVAAGGAFGISVILNYAALRINGVDKKDAIKKSAVEGVRTGIGVFCTAVIAGQLTKTGALNVFKPSSEALMEALGEDFSKKLLKAFGQKVLAEEAGKSTAESATKQAARLLRTEVLIAVVTTIVFTIPDAKKLFEGRISKKQFVKNFAVTAVSVVAGAIGYGVGGAVSQLVVPGVGTVPAGIVGSILFGAGGAVVADKIADYITDDDAEEMYAILADRFETYCDDYMVNEDEVNNILEKLSDNLNEKAFEDMYQSKDREKYADEMLEPLFDAEAAKREKIEEPTEEEMRAALKEELQGVVFVH